MLYHTMKNNYVQPMSYAIINPGGGKMSEFDKDWQTLNEKQQKAVTSITENGLILAPAGTGKTKVIAMRTAYLLDQNVLPSKILNLTFTNKASKEMENRIKLYAPEVASKILIKTFHSFCYYLINQEKENTHFSFPCTILDESDTTDILKRITFALTKQDIEQMYPLVQFIENVKKHSLSFESSSRMAYQKIAADYIKQNKVHDPILKEYGYRIWGMYQKYLTVNNCLDFIDLIIEATKLLENEAITKKWNHQFDYIQVDEMQDTSSREYALIKKLSKGNNITLYGDFNQTIYEWRGSSPFAMIEDFKSIFNPQQIDLTTNYRSTQLLLKAANDYIRNTKLYPLDCVPRSLEYGEPIEVFIAKDETAELRSVAKSIKNHLEGESPSIAILTRLNAQAKRMYKICESEGIDALRVEDIRLFRKKEVKELQAFFNYAINPRNSHALEKILLHPIINIEPWLLQELKKTQKSYLYLHDWFLADHSDPYHELFKAYDKNEIVVLDVESTGLDTTTDDIIQIAAIRYGKDGVSKELDILVKPTKSVGESVYIHGFTGEQLEAEGLEPSDALAQLLDFIEGYTLVGHNITYDLNIIQSMLHRYNQPALCNQSIYDTLDLACKVYPHLVNHKLDTLSELAQTTAKPNHNALFDILATGEVLAHLMDKIRPSQTERLEALEAYYPYVANYKIKLMSMINTLLAQTPSESIQYLLDACDRDDYYTDEALQQINDYDLISKQLYDEQSSYQDNLLKLLSFSALHYSEVEQSELFKNKIPIMTIHQAKGLEFDYVYMIGCNEGIFPLRKSVQQGLVAEEMRLFYVGMTRAKSKLFLSYNTGKKMSYFIEEIGEDFKIYSQTAK